MSNVTVKCTDLIRQYDGTGDFTEWLQKLELVAKLQKIDKLEQFLPLFLSGGAFAVYQGLSQANKEDYDKVKRCLTSAFSAGPLKAYEEFVARRLISGESVHVYLADLKRLAALVSPNKDEDWLTAAFVCGLPEEMRSQMQAACSLGTMTLAEVVVKARGLVTAKEACFVSVRSQPRSGAVRKEPAPSASWSRISCFTCRKNGHISRNCPERKESASDRFCYVCGGSNHLSMSCPQRKTEPAKNE